MKYLEIIKDADLFSVNFSPMIVKKNKQFKTYFGGIMSVLIYSIGLCYSLYYFYQWYQNNILPSVSQSIQLTDEIQYSMGKEDFRIQFQSQIDPFNQNQCILIPEIFQYRNQNYLTRQLQATKDQTVAVSNINMTLSYQENIYYVLTFSICDSLNKYNLTCATQNKIDEFFNQGVSLSMNITLQNYNPSSKSYQNYYNTFYYGIDQNVYSQNMVMLSTGKTRVDDGFLFGQSTYSIFMQKIQNIGQSLSKNYSINKFKTETLLSFYIQLDGTQYLNQVQYPLLGQILAQVGSIFSLLMTLSIVIQAVNQILLENYLIIQIISHYFPQFKKIKINKSLFKKDIRFQSLDKKIEYESGELIQIFYRAQEIAYNKLNILNILYEMSRIQFVLQSLQNRDMIQLSKQVGIKLPLKEIKLQQQVNNIKPQLKIQVKEYNQEQTNINQKQINIDNQNNNQVNENDINDQQLIDSDMNLLMIPNDQNNIKKEYKSIQSSNILYQNSNIQHFYEQNIPKNIL